MRSVLPNGPDADVVTKACFVRGVYVGVDCSLRSPLYPGQAEERAGAE